MVFRALLEVWAIVESSDILFDVTGEIMRKDVR